MSASFLPKTHIDVLLTAALEWGGAGGFRYRPLQTRELHVLTSENADEVGAMLWRTNYEATEGWNYPDGMPEYGFEEVPGTAEAVVVLKAIAAYGYQTGDEPEEFEGSEAYGFLTWLGRQAVRRLPGWGAAPWVIEEREVFLPGGAGGKESRTLDTFRATKAAPPGLHSRSAVRATARRDAVTP